MNTRVDNAVPYTASHPVPAKQGHWTYEDWLRLPDDGNRYEVIEGELIVSPPPGLPHQRSSGALFLRLAEYVEKHGLGMLVAAPVGVRLPGHPVPFQPDLVFVRQERSQILGEEYVEGAPDLVVEILSPSTRKYDRGKKFQVYQQAGVQEYWIVDQRARSIEVFSLRGKRYALGGKYGPGQRVASTVLPGFSARVEDLVPAPIVRAIAP
jgi:Uma2 family endonuclease